MKMHCQSRHRPAAERARGFSLVELLVALSIGLVLVVGMSSVYLFTKTAFSRQAQISNIQQNVRTAFEYLGFDARMVGHLGCFTGRATALSNELSSTGLATNYAVGVEGYEYTGTDSGDTYTLGSEAPANVTSDTSWRTSTLAGNTVSNTALITALSSGRTPTGLTPGSDVLVIRTVSGAPVRLTVDATATGTTLSIENIASGKCSDGTTSKVSGFCAGSQGLLASCSAARVFSVSSISGSVLTTAAPTAAVAFSRATAELLPLQTIAYYVAKSSSGTTTSLYRRVFNGDPAAGVEQELVEDVESMQVRYAVDTTTPDPDGLIDEYKRADQVANWSQVVAVRMGLLLRSPKAEAADVAVAASAPVNEVTMTFPSGTKYDRRVFMTTVAFRNKISYFP